MTLLNRKETDIFFDKIYECSWKKFVAFLFFGVKFTFKNLSLAAKSWKFHGHGGNSQL